MDKRKKRTSCFCITEVSDISLISYIIKIHFSLLFLLVTFRIKILTFVRRIKAVEGLITGVRRLLRILHIYTYIHKYTCRLHTIAKSTCHTYRTFRLGLLLQQKILYHTLGAFAVNGVVRPFSIIPVQSTTTRVDYIWQHKNTTVNNSKRYTHTAQYTYVTII